MKKIVLTLFLFGTLGFVSAQTGYYWKGTTDNNWNTLSNWESPEGTPATQIPGVSGNEAVDVYINSTATGQALVNINAGQNYMINRLLITSNTTKSTLVIAKDAVLNVNITTIGTSTTACLLAGGKISNAGSLLFSSTTGSLSNGIIRFTSGITSTEDSWLENLAGGLVDFNSSNNTNAVNGFSFGQTSGSGVARITNAGTFAITPNLTTANNYLFTVTAGDVSLSGISVTLGASGAGTLGGLISVNPSSAITTPVNVTLSSTMNLVIFNQNTNPFSITGTSSASANVLSTFTNNGTISITPQANSVTSATYGINISPVVTAGGSLSYKFVNNGTINLKGSFQNTSSMGIIRMFAPSPNSVTLENAGLIDIENTNTGTTASGAVYGNSGNTSNYTINNLSTGIFSAKLTGTSSNLDAIALFGSGTGTPVFNNSGKVIVKGKIGGNSFGRFNNNGEVDASDNIISNNTFIGATLGFINNGTLKVGLANSSVAATSGAAGVFFTSTGTISPTSATSTFATTNILGATLAFASKVNIEIGGNRNTSLWDRISFTSNNAQVDVSNMVFNLSLASGYTPAANDTVIFATASTGTASLNGTPTVNLPAGWSFAKNTSNTQLFAFFPGTLPVQLTSFSVKANVNFHDLTWATASEINNKGFYIERSNNGVNWESVGFVTGNGNASNYSFSVLAKFNVTYYRLRQVDVDGKSSYSKIVFIKEAATTTLSIFPNPTTQQLFVKLADVTNTKATVNIYAQAGNRVLTSVYSGSSFVVDVQHLANGTYILETISNNKKEQVRFIKQ